MHNKLALVNFSKSRDNNFNFIRFVAAVMVLISHSFPLTGAVHSEEPLYRFAGMTLGFVAVDIFFITSGFLISSSLNNRNNIVAFIWARVLRIYPALLIVILFCVFIVGLSFTSQTVAAYLSNWEIYKYILRNSILFFGIDHKLPGVFLSLPYPEAVNGSLWTLPYEVKMYAIFTSICVLISMIRRRWNLLTKEVVFSCITVIAMTVYILNSFYSFAIFKSQFLHLFTIYFIGVSFYYLRDYIVLTKSGFFLATTILLVSLINQEIFFISYNILLAYIVFCLAYLPGGLIRRFNNFGDYSYGIYIYAFPVQQSAIFILGRISVWEMIFVSFTFTFIFAFMSWHLIEKRSLKLKDRYVYIDSFLVKVKTDILALVQK